jgi:hypothetical protein
MCVAAEREDGTCRRHAAEPVQDTDSRSNSLESTYILFTDKVPVTVVVQRLIAVAPATPILLSDLDYLLALAAIGHRGSNPSPDITH